MFILTGCDEALLRLHSPSLRTPMDRVTMDTCTFLQQFHSCVLICSLSNSIYFLPCVLFCKIKKWGCFERLRVVIECRKGCDYPHQQTHLWIHCSDLAPDHFTPTDTTRFQFLVIVGSLTGKHEQHVFALDSTSSSIYICIFHLLTE